jgi:hypothetical protein
MSRLPQPGSDSGTWGTILNDYLSQSFNSDGTLKDSSVSASTLAGSAVTLRHIQTSAPATLNQVLSSNGTTLAWTTPPTAPVTSVAGRTGTVTLTKADVGLSNVRNIDFNGSLKASGMTAALSGIKSAYVPVPAGSAITSIMVYGNPGSVALYHVSATQYAAAPNTATGTLAATFTLTADGAQTKADVARSFIAGDFIYVVGTISVGEIAFRAEIG